MGVSVRFRFGLLPNKSKMGLISKLIKHTVKLPFNVVKDVVTLGGELTEEESALKKQAEEFSDDMDENEGLI